MPKITPISWKKLKKIFEADGFVKDRITGDHIVMVKDGVLRPVIIPKYSSVGRDIILNNMRTAGMSRDRYFELLNKV
ncbi:MAG: type II toxin-antitoxin system HicA family toxin [Candidatus Thiodiazotropha taylori]|uniref:Type II toxin-antitoxin system HicA family toxin n=1 Tax=Candidatus Thiodiazotropha taylori TaxID=2792791 RepID=A0A9E4KC02_9GAMM|nr:type II toxin-antitoxin system HicA family toxin [Candidatus Thiodiazotropha taylori]MCW4255952.1 type II toxin-antitoxin system HicA family toxin [Candidatus Thiodiazotropha taylori]